MTIAGLGAARNPDSPTVRTSINLIHKTLTVIPDGLIGIKDDRIPLSRENRKRINCQRQVFNSVGFDDGELMIVDGDVIVRETCSINEPEPGH